MKPYIILYLVSGLSLIAHGFIYSYLPDTVPYHWGINGEVDRTGPAIYTWLTASLPLLLSALFQIIPKIDPRTDSYKVHKSAFVTVSYGIVFFLIAIHWAVNGYNLGMDVDPVFVIRLLLGVLFILIGNVLQQARHNYTFGIRTPWTLANEVVWKKTHRLSARAFFVLGIIAIPVAFLPNAVGFSITIGGILLLIISMVLYSYLEYKKIA